MNRKHTVSIGIPTYNEESNIQNIITDVSLQKTPSVMLDKIIIYLDGCTDNTRNLIKHYSNPHIRLIENKERKGVTAGINVIMNEAQSDILIMINADVRIKDTNFIEKITKPYIVDGIDLAAARCDAVSYVGFLEKVLWVSTHWKKDFYQSINNGNNIYTCTGVGRAFSKKLYKSIVFPSRIGEDAFSFLFCIYHKFTYQYVHEAVVYYKLPGNMQDHLLQSIRYMQSKSEYIGMFGKEFIEMHYHVPRLLLIKSFLKYSAQYPLSMLSYVLLMTVVWIKAKFAKPMKQTWVIAGSSKKGVQI